MSPNQQADPGRYRNAWAALVQLVRDGHSWSGHERNRLFLNRGGAFSDVSVISGLDHDGDGRALAVVDWDRDGDLDLCYRNRTAPRLKLMLNSHARGGENSDEGTMVDALESGDASGAGGAGVPVRYRRRVGEYFQRVVEEAGDQ